MGVFRLVLLASLLSLSSEIQAEAIGSVFTYQGELKRLGVPANGTFDLKFGLYNLATTGSPVASAVQVDDVVVADGVFTVNLDFGSAAYNNEKLWLEIAVRDGASEGEFTTMLPRQVITPTPFALQALTVPDESITVGQIDPTSVQQRVTGACGSGFAISTVNEDGSVVCESDSDTQFTAGFGLNLSETQFSVRTNEIQRRVASSCPAGQSIQQINEDGTVTCHVDVDIDTKYSAGDGLSLSGTTFSNTHPNPSNVRWVATSGGDYMSIQAAIDSVTAAAADNPYLIKVAPGVYVGSVVMKPFVSIEGSGEGITIITSQANCLTEHGTLAGSDNAELRYVTVVNEVPEGVQGCAILNDQVSPRLFHVTANASGGTVSRAIYNIDSAPELIDVAANGGPSSSESYGIDNRGSSPKMIRVFAKGSGSPNNNIGLMNQSSQDNLSTPVLEHLTAVASGDNASNWGIRFDTSGKQSLSWGKIFVSGESSENIGIDNPSSDLSIWNTDIHAEGSVNGGSQGIRNGFDGLLNTYFVTIEASTSGGVGSQSIGLGAAPNSKTTLMHTNIVTSGGGNVGVGIIASLGASGELTIAHSRINAEADAARGISIENSPSGSLEVTNSQIAGSTNSVFNISTANVKIGSSQLINSIGTAGSGFSFICIGNFDKNFAALDSSCL